jgi:hypothetical protein
MFYIADQKDYRREGNCQIIGKEIEIGGKLRADDKSLF